MIALIVAIVKNHALTKDVPPIIDQILLAVSRHPLTGEVFAAH
jgi:hypothetical protein